MKNNRIKFEHNTIAWVSEFNAHAQPQMHVPCRAARMGTPSSGAAERAFSVLNNSFASNQDNSLSDYVETSIMLQYNGR